MNAGASGAPRGARARAPRPGPGPGIQTGTDVAGAGIGRCRKITGASVRLPALRRPGPGLAPRLQVAGAGAGAGAADVTVVVPGGEADRRLGGRPARIPVRAQ